MFLFRASNHVVDSGHEKKQSDPSQPSWHALARSIDFLFRVRNHVVNSGHETKMFEPSQKNASRQDLDFVLAADSSEKSSCPANGRFCACGGRRQAQNAWASVPALLCCLFVSGRQSCCQQWARNKNVRALAEKCNQTGFGFCAETGLGRKSTSIFRLCLRPHFSASKRAHIAVPEMECWPSTNHWLGTMIFRLSQPQAQNPNPVWRHFSARARTFLFRAHCLQHDCGPETKKSIDLAKACHDG